MRIALDLDGPVIDWVYAARTWYGENIGGRPPTLSPTCFSFREEWGLTREDWNAMFDWANAHAKPFPQLNVACLKDHEVHIVTARKADAMHQWILELLNPVSVWLGQSDKSLACFRIGADFIYDDAIHNLEQFKKSRTVAICNTQTWNTEWQGPRANTIADAIEVYRKWFEFEPISVEESKRMMDAL